MKTTVNIPDDLYREVKKLAADRKSSIGDLVTEALRQAMRPPGNTEFFRLADGSFRGTAGLLPGVDLSEWSQVRARIYEGRGE